MLHLIKNAQDQFEVVTVENGRYIVGSKQGYNTRQGCYTNMRAQLKNFPNATCVVFQDDTQSPLMVYKLYPKGKDNNNVPLACPSIKPQKRYIINSKIC